jgi:hypothetical protein
MRRKPILCSNCREEKEYPMEYSPLNTIVWLIFGAFAAITYITVKAFHKKYPDYPSKDKKSDFLRSL